MSIGIGGHARIVAEDSDIVIYEYYAYDWNVPELANELNTYDGSLMIDKKAFVEPTIRHHIKRWPSGRKEDIIKRIPNQVNIEALINNGMVTITKSRFGRPDAHIVLLHLIFMDYQKTGSIPVTTGYFQ